MRRSTVEATLCTLALISASCGGPDASDSKLATANPAAPTMRPEIAQAAGNMLGSDAEVLLFGDLARNGKEQVLVINRLKTAPAGTVPGILLTRAAVGEKEAGGWKEVFRCDDHLNNPNGFLAATPLAPVTGWRLQYETTKEKGLVMYFTPLQQPAGGYIQTIAVRWNPKVRRYQSLDRSFEQFQGEAPSLEMPTRRLRE